MSSMDPSNLTKEYMIKLFENGKRFDGRNLRDFREIKISHNISNKAEGSVKVNLGKTEVLVGVKYGIGAPYPDSPEKGNLMVTSELYPMASPRFESGPPGFKAIEIGRMVDRAIRESGVVEFEKLCIEKGEKVWTVFVDIYPINDDGNLLDASSIGAIAALRSAKAPSLNKDGNIDYSNRKDPVPLVKGISPISLSFYKVGNSIILDPTREEEEIADARVTFGISKWNDQLMLNSCQKIEAQTYSQEEIEEIMAIIPEKFKELNKKLKI